MDDECQYVSLGDEDVDGSLEVHRRGLFFWGKMGLFTTVLLLFLYEIVDLASGQKEQRAVVDHGSCGSTPEEARLNGCIFDLMSWCWLRPECYDETLSREMLSLGPWIWYENVEATRPVAQKVAALGEIEILYVEESFHHIHCTYIWKKMHRAYLGQSAIDSYIASFNHTIHCSNMLLRQGIPWDQVTTSVIVKYPTCDSIRRV